MGEKLKKLMIFCNNNQRATEKVLKNYKIQLKLHKIRFQMVLHTTLELIRYQYGKKKSFPSLWIHINDDPATEQIVWKNVWAASWIL